MSSVLVAVMAARWGKGVRVARVVAAAAGSRPGWVARWWCSRVAWVASAGAVLADSSHGSAAGRAGPGVWAGVWGGVWGGGLFEDEVGVGAADAEGGDGGAAGVAAFGPGGGLGEQADGAGVPVGVGGGLVDVQGLGQGGVGDGLDHFDDAGDPGGGLGVADVGFD